MSKEMRRSISQRLRNGEEILSGNPRRPPVHYKRQLARRARAERCGFRGLAAKYKVSPYIHWLINVRGGMYN